MPLFSETLWQFASLSDISQGSVATHLRCDGIFSDGIIANLLLILTVKQLQELVNIW